jgi:hypothetical protein
VIPATRATQEQPAQLAPQDKLDYKGRKETPAKLAAQAKQATLAKQALPVIQVLLDKQVLRAPPAQLALEE